MRTCIVVIQVGRWSRAGEFTPWETCDQPAQSRRHHRGASNYLCDHHYDLAFEAGRRFAAVGYIHHSKFTKVRTEGYGGQALTEAFAHGVRSEVEAMVLHREAIRQGVPA
jgi:hypothetical protein